MANTGQPSWWKDEYSSHWDSVREALRRDWEQTKHDLHAGGHELNQKIGDTVKQAAGNEPIPNRDKANPPRVIGDASDWTLAEEPTRYGFGARMQYGGRYPTWNDELDRRLHNEWDANRGASRLAWNDAQPHVRRGYEYADSKARRS